MKRAVEMTYFLLRVVAGFLFIQTGGLILFGWFGGMPGGENVRLMSQTGIGGVLEFFGGILFLYMAAKGGGEWSLDALIRRRARVPHAESKSKLNVRSVRTRLTR